MSCYTSYTLNLFFLQIEYVITAKTLCLLAICNLFEDELNVTRQNSLQAWK